MINPYVLVVSVDSIQVRVVWEELQLKKKKMPSSDWHVGSVCRGAYFLD